MAKVHTVLNTFYTRKDGTCPVQVWVYLNNKRLKFNTGVYCAKNNFIDGKIKGNSKTIRDNNLIIEKCLAQINDILVRYRLQLKDITPDLLKQEFKNPSRRIDFYAFTDEVLKERKNDIGDGTLKQHKSSLNKLREFKDPLAFSEINSELIEQYRKWLKKDRGNNLNTVHTALKNFKTYLNIAKRKGVIDNSPFESYKLKRARVDRTFLDEDELEAIYKLYKKNDLEPVYQKVLRHFLFMCFTGVRISDLMAFEVENVNKGLLVFIPQKTKNTKLQSIKMPLNSFAIDLIKDEGQQKGRLFNCISEQKMNLYIKFISNLAGVRKHITNHTARHTFATLYLKKTKDVAGLQKLLGHSNISETMIYVHITDDMLAEGMSIFDRLVFN